MFQRARFECWLAIIITVMSQKFEQIYETVVKDVQNLQSLARTHVRPAPTGATQANKQEEWRQWQGSYRASASWSFLNPEP